MSEDTPPAHKVEYPNHNRIQDILESSRVSHTIFLHWKEILWKTYFKRGVSSGNYSVDIDDLKDTVDEYAEYIAIAVVEEDIARDIPVLDQEEKETLVAQIREALLLSIHDKWEQEKSNLMSNISLGSAALVDALRSDGIEPTEKPELSDDKARTVLEKSLELANSIDKNSEGWDAILDARETLNKEFFDKMSTDGLDDIDIEVFRKALKTMALKASSRFTFENPVSYDDCLLLIMTGIDYDWHSALQRVQNNVEKADKAINAGFSEIDRSGAFDPIPGFNVEA
ncbi:MAG: hypothetical protein Q7T74_05090 [Candidatus Saccharibacteria bacterium]|nr:hypothetical protein [Candidatus Saccharibacteria bacterium]